ncbi:hypothetical protein APY03_3133 [Variovorax sp. WDL1]|nr:hypothetical protein APY03_3133 [Variovorax sp. WDL1]
MKDPAHGRQAGPARKRVEHGRLCSVILAIGAAALLGWLAVELYVKVVTLD